MFLCILSNLMHCVSKYENYLKPFFYFYLANETQREFKVLNLHHLYIAKFFHTFETNKPLVTWNT